MAALKLPILEIPLDDAQWQKFAASFRAYDSEVQKMPEHWKRTTAAILNQGSAFRQLGNSARPVESLWKNVAGFSGSILSTTMRITGELLKWGTILGGGLLGGSLFGITRMASDVASYRQRAMGLGMSIGGYRSFGVNFGRLGDPGGFLSAINQAISNPALQGPLYALGVNPTGSTGQVSVAMLKAMRQLALSTPRGELGLMSESYGLGPFGGLDKLMLLRAMGNKEFAQLLAGNAADKGPLGISSKTALAWQNFTTQLQRAGGEIFTVFVQGLAPLEKPLENLSAAFAGFLSRAMSGPEIKKGIDALASWLDTFSVKMESKKFKSAVDTLVSDTGTIAQGLHFLAKEIRIYMGWAHPGHELAQGAKGALAMLGMGTNSASGLPMLAGGGPAHWVSNPAQIKSTAAKLDAMFGFSPGTMQRLFWTESHFNPNAVSPKGAMGLGQLMPDTAWSYGLRGNMAFNPTQNMAASANYLASLVKHYHGNMQEALAAYNWGGANVDRLISRYGAGWRGHLPKGVNSYVTAISSDSSIVVTARHKTGGGAVLAGAGLAAVPGT